MTIPVVSSSLKILYILNDKLLLSFEIETMHLKKRSLHLFDNPQKPCFNDEKINRNFCIFYGIC